MRKAIADARSISRILTVGMLESLRKKGYKFVQVKGITVDNHYDYTEPSRLSLVPNRELPTREEQRDIYEPLESELLQHWAEHPEDGTLVVVAGTK
ncbi:MAG: hypothetical protein BGO55_28970 [Sphingobacteriales bacterium 50-39]|nr:hypothetical protein [Sphingobacteriales bacterium]OJW60585.1 MAG: hypothetical protein BGO55_28970 [Sphingobacteriales bacterium 50-39]